MFDVENTLSFNTDQLVAGEQYDYVTRTSQSQGVLQKTGFVNNKNINQAGNWSLGLLQMDFFYRQNPWYAGQFVRKITPKIDLTPKTIPFFTSALNKLKPVLLSVLVRNVDKTFLNAKLTLPATKNGEPDYEVMENVIAAIEGERIARLNQYLKDNGLDDYHLTDEEQQALNNFENTEWGEFKVIDIFDVKNTRSILSRDITPNSGKTPYLCASSENNGVSSYITYDEKYLDQGDCIFIGGKTFVVSFQEYDFFSNDSHNLALYLKNETIKDKANQLYLATCINKSLGYKYSWGDSISKTKIKKDTVSLPIKEGEPDYAMMDTIISAIKKRAIKDVVLYVQDKQEAGH